MIGVDVGETAFLVELFDFGLNLRARHASVTDMTVLDPEDAVSHIVEGIESVIAEAAVEPGRILGVGVAVPGLVEHRGDAVVHGQSVGWHAVPLEAMLRDRTGLPILVDNGAKTLGQAERWFGAARGTDNAVIVLLGIGVGTCIISNGEVYRGATSSAGEWGHTTVCVGGRTCRCGADGCLEAYVGAGAIAARYEQLKRRRVTVSPGELEGRVAAIIAARDSDRAAAQVLDETITYLGAGIADLVNLFNPERVVVGGWLGRALGDDAAAADPGGGGPPGAASPVQPGRDRHGRPGPGRGRPGRRDAADRPAAHGGRGGAPAPGQAPPDPAPWSPPADTRPHSG